MSKKPIVFIDVDGTLVSTKPTCLGRLIPTKKCPVFDVSQGENKFTSMARPSAAIFISELKKRNYEIIICTSGGAEFQSLVLKTIGIKGFERIIGLKEMEGTSLKITTPWVLVDDLNPGSSGVINKMSYLGVENACLIECLSVDRSKELLEKLIMPKLVQVAYFDSDEPTSSISLIDYIPEIEEKIKLQQTAF